MLFVLFIVCVFYLCVFSVTDCVTLHDLRLCVFVFVVRVCVGLSVCVLDCLCVCVFCL